MAADGAIRFEISLDLGKIKTEIENASKKIDAKFSSAFSKMGKRCQDSCNQTGKEFQKMGADADQTRKKIDAILADQTKSMKSKAASIAWIYRKQGMEQSEAMKKAWTEIERSSDSGSEHVKKSIKGIGNQSKRTSKEISSGLGSALKKIGTMLISAFAIKKLVDFSKECVELGSDLSEVQNVVDVTFPHMSEQINQFAKNAASQFGLSETMSKRFTGTFGAMAKAFGFGEKAAYDMSTTLTGLAGDVASFYNINQDEAYTKLKSVFTGETESLKDLGIVMTQTALDAYALQNGFGKTSAQMSEMEKVALRYKFVQDQLSTAAGDFSRTSDGWANQVRILQLQFGSLKATIGQGLINVLSPVIKVINAIIGKLMSLANAFKAFTEFITGNKGSGVGASSVAADMGAVADSAGDAASGMNKAAGAAKKAKQAFGLAKFDELNVVSSNDSSGGGSGSAGSGGGYKSDQFDMGTLPEDGDAVSDKLKNIVDLMNQLKSSFSQGFWDAFGDTSVFDSIQGSIQSIKSSLNDIFSDSDVQAAATKFANTFAYSLGQVAGSVASVGATIADNLLGGISLYLQQDSGRIKEYLIAMFDIGGEIASLVGNFTAAFADIFSVFRSDSAKQITADIIKLFSDAFMGVQELALSFARDVLAMITEPVTRNADTIKQTLNGLLESVQTITGSIVDTFEYFVDGVLQLYDEHIGPLIQSFTDGLSEIADTALSAFNTYILPVIQDAADQFAEFNDSSLKPLIDAFLEFAGAVADSIGEVWNNVLVPFINWFIENIAPVIGDGLKTATDVFFSFGEAAAEVAENVLGALKGLIEFITGVLTGDWERAWNGLKDIFRNVFNGIVTIAEKCVNAIVSGLNKLSFDVPDWSPIGGGSHFGFDLSPVSLPRLAQGGFVKANTPRLAMIGDNRNYGEIVAPENKMMELLNKAVELGARMTGGNGGLSEEDIYYAFKRALEEADLTASVDSDKLFKAMKAKAAEYKRRTGKPAFE